LLLLAANPGASGKERAVADIVFSDAAGARSDSSSTDEKVCADIKVAVDASNDRLAKTIVVLESALGLRATLAVVKKISLAGNSVSHYWR
jgi:hypothetical protein